MSKSSHLLVDLLRLLLLIALLPLIILLAGPLLVVAAILGDVSVFGVVKLAPGKHLRWGRLWAFIIGLLLWMIVWGSAAWLWLNYAPTFTSSAVRPATPTIQAHSSPSAGQAFQPAPSPTIGPTATSISTPEPTATIVIATDTPTSSPTAAPLPSAAPSNTPIASPTSTTVVATPQALPATATPTPTILSPPAARSLDEEAGVFDAIASANNLLVEAIQAPTDANLAALESVWQGQALDQVGHFVRQVNQKYPFPLQVRYSIIGLPKVVSDTASTGLLVQSREFWTFEAEDRRREALSDYKYTLQPQGDDWVITFYQFKNIPLPTNPNAITGTEILKDEG